MHVHPVVGCQDLRGTISGNLGRNSLSVFVLSHICLWFLFHEVDGSGRGSAAIHWINYARDILYSLQAKI